MRYVRTLSCWSWHVRVTVSTRATASSPSALRLSNMITMTKTIHSESAHTADALQPGADTPPARHTITQLR